MLSGQEMEQHAAAATLINRMLRHVSAATEQLAAEDVIRAAAADQIRFKYPNLVFEPRTFVLPRTRNARVKIDGASLDPAFFIEIYAHQGPLKGNQPDKLLADALKLSLVRDLLYPSAELRLVLSDHDAADGIMKGWPLAALRGLGVDVWVVDIPADLRAALVSAQERQGMVNKGTLRGLSHGFAGKVKPPRT